MKSKNLSVKYLVERFFRPVPVVVAAGLLIVGIVGAPLVSADSIQDQINSLNAQNNQVQSTVNQLGVQAGSYKQAINQLEAKIASIQNSIKVSQANQAKLNVQIQALQVKLNQQKAILGADIKSMYVNGQMTTIEELASSKNLSTFVDAQTYRNAVQDEVQTTMAQITALQNKLNDQEQQVTQLLDSQKLQQQQLASDQQQQAQLLAMNEQQQANFNQKLKTNNAQIQKLQAQKEAELQALGGNSYSGGTGSYPWANAPCPDPNGGPTCDNYDWAYPSGPYDPWGYQYRNCTSYVAWKIVSTSSNPNIGSFITGLGNAADWPGNVPQSWIDSSPRHGDAAVVGGVADGQGHVMYVESVNGNGTINVSQYNYYPGAYSTTDGMSPSGITFIHFPGT